MHSKVKNPSGWSQTLTTGLVNPQGEHTDGIFAHSNGLRPLIGAAAQLPFVTLKYDKISRAG